MKKKGTFAAKHWSRTERTQLASRGRAPWAPQKHHYYSEYIERTSDTRQKYLRPSGGRRYAGGAAVIDLFAGPGRARIRPTGAIIDGARSSR